MKFWDDMQEGIASAEKIIMIGNPDNGMPEHINLGVLALSGGSTKTLQKLDDEKAGKSYFFNVSQATGKHDYATNQEARADVPQDVRKTGIQLTYKTINGWVFERFLGVTKDTWGNILEWETISKDNVLTWKGAVSSTRLQVAIQDRKKGLIISYVNGNDELVTEQFVSNTFGDTDWASDLGWLQFETQEKTYNKYVGSLFNIIGYVRKGGAFSTDANFLRTDYLPINDIDNLVVSAYSTGDVSALSYFDEKKQWIADIDDVGDILDKIITPSERPVNTKFIIASANKSFRNKKVLGCSISSIMTTLNEAGKSIASTNDRINSVDNKLSDNQFESIKLDEESGNVNNNTGVLGSSASYLRTPLDKLLKIEEGKEYAYSGTILTTLYGGVVCYDADKKFFGSVNTDIGRYDRAKVVLLPNTSYIQYVGFKDNWERGLFEVSKAPKTERYDALESELSSVEYTPETTIVIGENGAFKINGDIEARTDYQRTQTGIQYAVELIDGIEYYYSGEIEEDYAGCLFYRENGSRFSGDGVTAIFSGLHRRTKIKIPFEARYMSVSSKRNSDIEIGIFKGVASKKMDEVYPQRVMRYPTFEACRNDFKRSETAISVVGNYLYNNLSNTIIGGDNKQVIGGVKIKEKKALNDYYLFDWDDEKKEGLFRLQYQPKLFTSSDFVNFEEIAVFDDQILNARYTNDGKIICCILTKGSTIGGIFKGDKNGFTKKITWSTNTATHIEQWGYSQVGSTIVINEYDSSQNTVRQTTCVYISRDHGETFTEIFDFHASKFYQDIIAAHPDSKGAAHIHGCCYDPYENRVWLATGDKMCKWVVYSEPITDVNNVVWKGMYLDTQFCPVYAIRNGIVAGTDHKDNAMYIIHRGSEEIEYPNFDVNHENVYPLDSENHTITYVPGVITTIGGVIFAPCNAWIDGKHNKIVASVDGVNWCDVWLAELPKVSVANCKIYAYNNGVLIFDNSDGNRVLICGNVEVR